MNIAIMSDSHNAWDNLDKAIQIANERGCQYLLHAGDLVSYLGVSILVKFKGKVFYVWGNNELYHNEFSNMTDPSGKIEFCGETFVGEIDGFKTYMTHLPSSAEIAASSGDFDLCIYGHAHDYQVQQFGHTLLVNPGEVVGSRYGIASFAIFDTVTKSFEKIII